MARSLPQTRYARSDGAMIAYQISGAGPPDLLLVPGLVSHLEIQWQQPDYRRFVHALERGGRVIRLDKRGTGLSDPTEGVPSTLQRMQDLGAVLTAAHSGQPVLLGISDGGRAAIAFAATYPERTRALILYGTSYRGPRAAQLRRYRSAVRHWGDGRLLDIVAPSLASTQSRAIAGAFERAAASPGMAAALVESLGLLDVRDLMGQIAVPTLVLHRSGDFLPVADARLVASHIPGATLKVLAGADHLPWVGDWPALAEEIIGFAQQVAPGQRQRRRPQRASEPLRPRRPALGWESLTQAELDVVLLVAAGHSNARIAAMLYLSRYTVETHLKHVFAKLGVESRTELAALAAAHPESAALNT
jgi:pimeloyl-ACP methyl ester carboxylesterase/DNA-binding CsgD family transcriptional regulator